MALVYMATDKADETQFYVGFSDDDDLHHRRRSHEHDASRAVPRTRFDRALKVAGSDGFEWETLWQGISLDEARRREIDFVRWLCPTLNGNRGGSGGLKTTRRRRILLPVTIIHGEKWLPIPGFEGHYEVSDHGRIKSLRRTVANPVTGVMVRPSGLMRTPAPRGRPIVTLCKDGKEYNRRVQAIVAEAFIGPRPGGFGVLHRDDDKMNNRPGNLYYGTHADNMVDRDRNGRTAWGERSGTAAITEETAREILRLDATGVRKRDIVIRTGASKQIVASITRGRSWRHLGSVPRPPQTWNYPDRAVICLNTGQWFAGPVAAAGHFAIRPSKIVEICDGRRTSARSFVFRYEGEHGGLSATALIAAAKDRRSRTRRSVLSINDGIRYPTIKSAAEAYGVSMAGICDVCRGRAKTAGGKVFCYAE